MCNEECEQLFERRIVKEVEDYVKSDGVYCPYCSGENISSFNETLADPGTVHVSMHCDDCKAEWVDCYHLHGIYHSDDDAPIILEYWTEAEIRASFMHWQKSILGGPRHPPDLEWESFRLSLITFRDREAQNDH